MQQPGTKRTGNINLPNSAPVPNSAAIAASNASKRTTNINLPKSPTSKPREDIFTSTPPGGKPYGNKKPLPKPGTPAARNAPMRDEPLF